MPKLFTAGGLTVLSNYSYEFRFASTAASSPADFSDGSYALACGALTPSGHHAVSSGSDASSLGAWTSLSVGLVGADTCSAAAVNATFTHYSATDTLLFTQSFPSGLPPAASSTAVRPTLALGQCSAGQANTDVAAKTSNLHDFANATASTCCAACVAEGRCNAWVLSNAEAKDFPPGHCFLLEGARGTKPSSTRTSQVLDAPAGESGLRSAFPLFKRQQRAALNWVTWGSTEIGGAAFAPVHFGNSSKLPGGSQTTGPIVVFDGATAHGEGLVLSTFDEHFTNFASLSAEGGLAGGVSDAVEVGLPRGYSTSMLLQRASGGVTNVTMAWGAALQRAHAEVGKDAERAAMMKQDVVVNKLGYWTDNQAFYDWYHWFPNVSSAGKPQDVLIALQNEFKAKELSVGYFQLDAYWYRLEVAPACCVVDWHAVLDQFPKGLAWLTEQLGAPLLLYTDTWCKDNAYRSKEGGAFDFMDNDHAMSLSWFKGNTSNVVPSQSKAFYTEVMKIGLEQGMAKGGFEVDFLNFNFDLYVNFRTIPGAHAEWLKGLDDASWEANVSTQYCMVLAQQLVHAATSLRTVTSARAAPDGGRPFWGNSGTAMLLAALGLRPFYDNSWTSGKFPKGWADVTSAVLSMGPVGLADALGKTDAVMAQSTCTRDGTLLHPSKPATPIDATYFPAGTPHAFAGVSLSTAWSGPAQASSALPRWYLVLASGVSPTYVLPAAALYPPPAAAQALAVWRNGSACVTGAPVAKCASLLDLNAGFSPRTGRNTVAVYHLAPVAANGWALLGEARKIVPVASARFESVNVTPSGLSATVRGVKGERIELLFAKVVGGGDSTLIISKAVTLPASGRATMSVP